MKKNIDNEKKIKKIYNRLWSDTNRIHRNDDNLVLGWHLGFYEKGIKNQKEAMINMNNFVGKLLGLNSENLMKILDAGCGVGATSIHLANKYPDITFIGITLAPNEIELAEKLQKEKNVENTKFLQRSFFDTGFPNEYFDCVFALESVSCTKNKKKFLNEMYKILKPGGKIVIIDFFRKHDSFNSFVKNMRYNFLRELEFPLGDVSINTFKLYNDIEGFKNINIYNLLTTGNVKYLHLYGFIISSIFKNSYANIQTQFKDNIKDKTIINFFRMKCAFFIKFVLECVLLLIAKPGYYSITAVKNEI